MATMMEPWNAVVVVVLTAVIYQLVRELLWNGLWEPLRLRGIMVKQGVKALPFRFLLGQLPEQAAFLDKLPEVVAVESFAALSPTVTPQYALFFPRFPGEKYFLYRWRSQTRLVVRDPEIAKEVFFNHSNYLEWSASRAFFLTKVIGRGLVILTGKKWATERRTLNPFFHQDALKGMVGNMVEGTATEIHKWEHIVAGAGGTAEIDVEADIHKMSGRVLALTAFGGDFKAGEQVYKLQMELSQELNQMMMHDVKSWLIPFYRNIPTKRHRDVDQKASNIDALVRGLIQGRLDAVRDGDANSLGNDLLGLMLHAATEGWQEDTAEFNLASVLNNGKLFHFAGQDTVANSLTFVMLMLALHPDWQHRARNEVLQVLGHDDESFDASVLSHLKVVGMIVNETLRCFAPAASISRVASKDMQLKSLLIPKGMTIELAVVAVHQNREFWGEDVAEWNPERFAQGVAGACSHQQAFCPFGLGPKICIGNNFAMMEMKVLLARVLRRFELLPSPRYRHHPTAVVTMKPKFGLPLILKARQVTTPATTSVESLHHTK